LKPANLFVVLGVIVIADKPMFLDLLQYLLPTLGAVSFLPARQ
jgi:hypothetical protein